MRQLRDAAEHANAVESVACSIDLEAKRELASALHPLVRDGFLTHSVLTKALEKSFVSTSDERGNRCPRFFSKRASLAKSPVHVRCLCISFRLSGAETLAN